VLTPRRADRRLAEAVGRWSLEPVGPVRRGTASLLVDVRAADGHPAVVKVTRRRSAALREATVLRALAPAAVAVEALEPDLGALLLEQALPGTPLTSAAARDDDAATRSFAAVVASLRPSAAGRPSHDTVPRLDRAVAAWLGAAGRPPVARAIGRKRLDRAAALAAELRRSADSAIVLHGDLHHDNVLAATRRPYLVVDPEGFVGDPTAELACFLRNPIDHLTASFGPLARLRRRIAVLTEMLGDPAERIRSWAYVGAVVSAGWSASAGEAAGPWLAVADELVAQPPSRRRASARSSRPS
jgi:streptomycin 6-kinase